VAVYLDRRTCAGQRTCTTTAPTVFRYSADRDYSEVITEVVGDPAIITQVHDAEDLCPIQSIHVTS
jgi:ferredoxin